MNSGTASAKRGMFDLIFQGTFYTWLNHQPANPIVKKLDTLNSHWISNYSNSSTSFQAPEFSDHSSCIIDLSFFLPKVGSKPFKFFNFLTKYPKFLITVKDGWIQAGNYASILTILSWNFKNLKRALKTLNGEKIQKFK